MYWELYTAAGVYPGKSHHPGFGGDVVGMSTFGESAPGADLFKHFGFTVENVINKVKAL